MEGANVYDFWGFNLKRHKNYEKVRKFLTLFKGGIVDIQINLGL